VAIISRGTVARAATTIMTLALAGTANAQSVVAGDFNDDGVTVSTAARVGLSA
jgi:hypothetical protein